MFRFPLGEGVELRLIEDRHADELWALIDRNRAHLRAWMSWLDQTTSVADTRGFITGALRQYADNDGFQAGIWVDGALAGIVGYHQWDWVDRKTEIGYWLGAAYEGRGIMTRACRALVEYALADLGLNRVEIQVATGNRRSQGVPERLGFTREGVLREAGWLYDHFVDHIMYSMLAADWRKLGLDDQATQH